MDIVNRLCPLESLKIPQNLTRVKTSGNVFLILEVAATKNNFFIYKSSVLCIAIYITKSTKSSPLPFQKSILLIKLYSVTNIHLMVFIGLPFLPCSLSLFVVMATYLIVSFKAIVL